MGAFIAFAREALIFSRDICVSTERIRGYWGTYISEGQCLEYPSTSGTTSLLPTTNTAFLLFQTLPFFCSSSISNLRYSCSKSARRILMASPWTNSIPSPYLSICFHPILRKNAGCAQSKPRTVRTALMPLVRKIRWESTGAIQAEPRAVERPAGLAPWMSARGFS